MAQYSTTHSIGDTLWIIKDNHCLQVIISCIYISVEEGDKPFFIYHARNATKSKSKYDHTQLKDADLFLTRKELLETL